MRACVRACADYGANMNHTTKADLFAQLVIAGLQMLF